FGFLIDSRGTVEIFMPGNGFVGNVNKSFDTDALSALLELSDGTSQSVLLNKEMALGILPRRVDTKVPPRVIGINVPTLGSALILEARTPISASTEPTLTLHPDEL